MKEESINSGSRAIRILNIGRWQTCLAGREELEWVQERAQEYIESPFHNMA